MINNNRQRSATNHPLTESVLEFLIRVSLTLRLLPLASLFHKSYSKLTGKDLSPPLEVRVKKSIMRKRDYDFVFHLGMFAAIKLAFRRLSSSILKFTHFIERRLKRLLASKIFMLIIRRSIYVIAAVATAFLLYKLGLYSYYKYNNDQKAANLVKRDMLGRLNHGYKRLKLKASIFMDKVYKGGIIMAISLSLSIVVRAIFRTLFGFDASKETLEPHEDFMNVVIFAPIIEEFVYRGIVLNIFNKFYNWINPVEREEYIDKNNPIEIVGHIAGNYLPPEDNILLRGNIEKNITTMPNLVTALLFADAHAPHRRRGALLHGLVFGGLTTKDDGDITSSVAAHMTNNAMVFCLTRLGL